MGRDRRGDLEWFAFYYDPIEREAMTFPDNVSALAAPVTLPYIYPQRPECGQWLYEQSVAKLGWSNPRARINQFVPDPRTTSIALLMAHELGDDVTEARMRAYVEERSEPRTFGEEEDRFGFFFGWGEPYPRGQHSALLMSRRLVAVAHGRAGRTTRTSGSSRRRRSRASSTRHLACQSRATTLSAASCCSAPTPQPRRKPVARPACMSCSCPTSTRFASRATGRSSPPGARPGRTPSSSTLTIGDHALVLWTGYHGQRVPVAREHVSSTPTVVTGAPVAPSPAALAAVASCRCC